MKKTIEYIDDDGYETSFLPFDGLICKKVGNRIAFYNLDKLFSMTQEFSEDNLEDKFNSIKAAMNAR